MMATVAEVAAFETMAERLFRHWPRARSTVRSLSVTAPANMGFIKGKTVGQYGLQETCFECKYRLAKD